MSRAGRSGRERVSAMSGWLNANGLRVTGTLVGIFGVGLVVQGAGALAR